MFLLKTKIKIINNSVDDIYNVEKEFLIRIKELPLTIDLIKKIRNDKVSKKDKIIILNTELIKEYFYVYGEVTVLLKEGGYKKIKIDNLNPCV